MFLKAIREMEESEAEHRRLAGDAYAEPQTLRWARLDLASTEEEITRLQSGKQPD